MTIQERVATGARLLDIHKPDWYTHINLGDVYDGGLEMTDCMQCVLGQLYGRFSAGYRQLSLTVTEASLGGTAADCGFTLRPNETYHADKEREAWANLRDAWAAEIEARRTSQTGEAHVP